MRREVIAPRANWQRTVEGQGFTFHTAGKEPAPGSVEGTYWCEDRCYHLTAGEVDRLWDATEELHRMCLDAVDHVVRNPHLMDHFTIPEDIRPLVIESWKDKEPYLMGRFDLAFDPESGDVKMLEYNADTPTTAIETSLVQHFWRLDAKPDADQFNSFEEDLIERFGTIRDRLPKSEKLYFSALGDNNEEREHEVYFMNLARRAGIPVEFISIYDIGWHPDGYFCDLEEKPIRFLHKLYPWEWMIDEFSNGLKHRTVGLIEPAWKMLLSNKAVLPVLWSLFPEHDLLAPASFEKPTDGKPYVAKAILGREGANIEMVGHPDGDVKTGGFYADNPVVYQGLVKLPKFDGMNVVIGSWVVGDKPSGIIIRENNTPVVLSTSPVVPHYF